MDVWDLGSHATLRTLSVAQVTLPIYQELESIKFTLEEQQTKEKKKFLVFKLTNKCSRFNFSISDNILILIPPVGQLLWRLNPPLFSNPIIEQLHDS